MKELEALFLENEDRDLTVTVSTGEFTHVGVLKSADKQGVSIDSEGERTFISWLQIVYVKVRLNQ